MQRRTMTALALGGLGLGLVLTGCGGAPKANNHQPCGPSGACSRINVVMAETAPLAPERARVERGLPGVS